MEIKFKIQAQEEKIKQEITQSVICTSCKQYIWLDCVFKYSFRVIEPTWNAPKTIFSLKSLWIF